MRRRWAPVGAGILLVLLIWLLRERRHWAPPEVRVSPPLHGLDRAQAETPSSRLIPPLPQGSERQNDKNAAVDRLMATIDWTAYGTAVISFLRVQEEALRSGRPAKQDPAMIEILGRDNQILEQIAKELGVEDSKEIRFHERVWPSFARGWLKAAGVGLSEGQDQVLEEAARVHARSRAEASKAVEGANRLERLAWDAEQGLRWDRELQKVLTADQFDQYAQVGGVDPFWGRQTARREIRLESVEGAAREVQQLWLGILGLDPSLRPQLADAATEFAREAQRQLTIFRAQSPGEATREEQMRFRIALLDLQAKAERNLGQRLRLTALQLERVGEGTGTILVWR